MAARRIADVWDQNTAHEVMSPIGARLESVCERWLVELFGLPPDCAAGFVTGTMMANFSAMAAARNHLLRRMGWDVAARGLYQRRVCAGSSAPLPTPRSSKLEPRAKPDDRYRAASLSPRHG